MVSDEHMPKVSRNVLAELRFDFALDYVFRGCNLICSQKFVLRHHPKTKRKRYHLHHHTQLLHRSIQAGKWKKVLNYPWYQWQRTARQLFGMVSSFRLPLL